VLTQSYERAEADKVASALVVEEASRKLGLAQRLMRALSDENVRWGNSLEDLNSRRRLLTGDVLLGVCAGGSMLSHQHAPHPPARLPVLSWSLRYIFGMCHPQLTAHSTHGTQHTVETSHLTVACVYVPQPLRSCATAGRSHTRSVAS
jgi:hypothetical protein